MNYDSLNTFCTAITCMDGRIQSPVNRFLKEKFNASYVDVITEPGPNLILAQGNSLEKVNSIYQRVDISVSKHHSKGIAVVGHHDCAGNPTPYKTQREHILLSVEWVKKNFNAIPVIGLWVNTNWEVEIFQSN